MKKFFALLLALVMALGLLAGCGDKTDGDNTGDTDGAKKIETLKVAFVPSREPEEIITVTEPLKQMLKDELAKQGYEVGDVEITVGTTYEAVGEGLEAGTIDVGLIPGGTYVLYDDGAEVILTATRDGLSKDSDNAKDWNDGQPTEASDKQAVSYRALFIAGPSDKGQELVKKVNAGEELTWEDLDSANWSVMGTSSPAGYIYPALWLQDHYGKGISDLKSAVQSDSYASAFARLASGSHGASSSDVLCLNFLGADVRHLAVDAQGVQIAALFVAEHVPLQGREVHQVALVQLHRVLQRVLAAAPLHIGILAGQHHHRFLGVVVGLHGTAFGGVMSKADRHLFTEHSGVVPYGVLYDSARQSVFLDVVSLDEIHVVFLLSMKYGKGFAFVAVAKPPQRISCASSSLVGMEKCAPNRLPHRFAAS